MTCGASSAVRRSSAPGEVSQQNADSVPPRKGVTAWEIEPMVENGDEFFVLTFHHGLGRMTRLDLAPEEVGELARALTNAQNDSSERP